MTVIHRTIRSSHLDALASLQALVSITGLTDSITFSKDALLTTNNNKDSADDDNASDNKLTIEMLVSATNPFNATTGTYVVHGLTGVARTICALVPESGLWGEVGFCMRGGGEERGALVESWVETCVGSLGGVAYALSDERVKDPLFQSQVTEFANQIESHLFTTDNTYLVGDVATAADVIVSIILAKACDRVGLKSVPQQTARLVETLLNNPVVAKSIAAHNVTVPTAGVSSPAERRIDASSAPSKTKDNNRKKDKDAAVAEEKKDSSAASASVASPADTPPAAEATASLTDNPIAKKLNSLNIAHDTYAHPPCMTAEELVANVPVPPDETHTKNLLFRDKKHGMFLVTVKPDAEVNPKSLAKALKLEGRTNLRLADEQTLLDALGVKKGCVGPLAIVNNSDQKNVTLVLDEKLFSMEKIHSHPLRNDASTVLTPGDLKTFLEKVGVEPTIIPFESKGEGGAAGAAPPASAAAASADIDATEKWDGKAPASRPPEKKEKPKAKPAAAAGGGGGGPKEKPKDKKTTKKGETLLALQWKKEENFAMWYSDVIVLSEMISYYDISGCYILRPWSYKIWELIQDWFNPKIRELGVENCYFPLFVSQDRLEKEKDHVEGFAPEVAWVTKSGDDTLAKPIAVRPTSETIMYPAFADWIRSHRDLPLKLNQWSNVVRWEFKDPTPFLRSREFLWQEGHTAHVSHDDADVMVMQALELYRGVYEDLLAVPVIKGYKTEKEKFAGGHQTTTVEAYIPLSGRAIQGATSHNLGQNFGKMFEITFQDEKGNSQIAWQTSWGLTTRTIGVMIMVHGDDMGLVLPPRIAPLQVVIVPIVSKKCTIEDVSPYCEDILKNLVDTGIRAKFDDRTMYNPGWKYNHWEQKGVPIRIEVGPRDIEQKQARVVVRFNNEKFDVGTDVLASTVKGRLETIQSDMFEKAKESRDNHLVRITEWKDFVPNLEKHNLVLTPWCGGEYQDWEEWVKEKSREESLTARGEEGEDARAATSVAAKTLCIPFNQPELPEGTKCIASGLPAKCWVLWGRSY